MGLDGGWSPIARDRPASERPPATSAVNIDKLQGLISIFFNGRQCRRRKAKGDRNEIPDVRR